MGSAVHNFVGILGWPLTHTLSPVIHTAAFRRLGFDWAYLAFPVAPERLGAAIDGLRALGAIGANVTIPHKETCIPHLDQVSGDAGAIGAVNTIQRIGDRLVGHNTDIDGFSEFISGDAGIDVDGRRTVVLGAGGAARAVVRALDVLGAAEITVLSRRPEQGAALKALVTDARGEFALWKDRVEIARGADLVVNTTPIGSEGEDPLGGLTWGAGQAVVDLVYSPPSTPLVEAARAGGAVAWGGIGMLVRQAAASFRIWTGQDPPLETMSAAVLHAIGPSGSTRPHSLPNKD